MQTEQAWRAAALDSGTMNFETIEQPSALTLRNSRLTDCSRKFIDEVFEQSSNGRLVSQFESGFASLLGLKTSVAVNSGIEAAVLALGLLYSYGAKPGDEIIVPALSFEATVNAVIRAGFKPVFVDVECQSFNIDPDQVQGAITEKTRAIMPAHLMGKPADMNAINDIARQNELLVVEDALHAYGTMYYGRPAGSLADLGVFSLYEAHIITNGEGGIITAPNEEHVRILRLLCSQDLGCDYSQSRADGTPNLNFICERSGSFCKMDELEAAIALGSMEDSGKILARRRQNLLYVLYSFGQFAPFLSSIHEEPFEQIGPHAIPIIIQQDAAFTRLDLMRYLKKEGIETRPLFASLPTQCPGFELFGHQLGEFPVAEHIGNHGLYAGVHHGLGFEHMEYLLDTLGGFLEIYQT
jgi:dTDP-4-amino-4,6-dideoxygalactose transaminase